MNRPCVRCLSEKIVRKRAGAMKSFCVIQCVDCGQNVTAPTFENAESLWNGYGVWSLVDKLESAAVKLKAAQ